MPEDRYQALARYLLDCGIEPKFAARICTELRDHYADLEREALAAERTPEEAAAEAALRLGDDEIIAREFVRRPELRIWIYRSEWVLRCLAFVVAVVAWLLEPLQSLADRGAAMLRYGAAAAAAFLVTCALLLGLHVATRYDFVDPERPQPVRVELTESGSSVIIEEYVAADDRSMPRRPRAEGPLPPANYEFRILADTSRAVDLEPTGLADGEYVPIVKVAPVYPEIAVSRGIEGYVVVEFTVTPTGSVRDVIVVESSSELFNEAAIEATSQFKYKPRIVSGRPVEVSGVRNRITFVLEA